MTPISLECKSSLCVAPLDSISVGYNVEDLRTVFDHKFDDDGWKSNAWQYLKIMHFESKNAFIIGYNNGLFSGKAFDSLTHSAGIVGFVSGTALQLIFDNYAPIPDYGDETPIEVILTQCLESMTVDIRSIDLPEPIQIAGTSSEPIRATVQLVRGNN